MRKLVFTAMLTVCMVGVSHGVLRSQSPSCAVLDSECKIAEYTKLIEADPKNIDAHLARGFLYETKGDYPQAIRDMTTFILKSADKGLLANAYTQRAACYRLSYFYDEAILDYTSAINLDGKNSRLFYSRAALFMAIGNYDQAIVDFTSAMTLDPKHSETVNYRGNAYLWKKDRKKAFIDFNRAIELDPGNASAYFNRAYEYADRKEYAKAIVDYDKFIELNSKYFWTLPPAYKNRGLAYFNLKRNDLAIADLTMAIRLAPTDPRYYVARAFVYRQLKEDPLADADEKQAAKLR